MHSDYFHCIDSEEKAYWLGLLTADGNVSKNFVTVGLQRRDRGHLEKLKEAVKTPAEVCDRLVAGKYESSVLAIGSKDLTLQLIALGVGPKKSLIVKPWVGPEHLIRHYWRGVFDGDGSISQIRDSGWLFRLVGNQYMMPAFQEFARQHCNSTGKIRQHSQCANAWEFSVGGRTVPQDLARVLYEGATVYLDRKKAKADELLAATWTRKKHPNAKEHVSPEQLRAEYEAGEGSHILSKRYGICANTVLKKIRIAGGTIWSPPQEGF